MSKATTAEEVVQSFAGSHRYNAYQRLRTFGSEALSAVLEGLKDENWHVRHWCAIYLDRQGDAESVLSLLPLLTDPVAKVRLWAVHSISCEHCKEGECTLDVVPLLIDRIECDESLRVRKMAVAMLGMLSPDQRALPVLQAVLKHESDPKIRLHAGLALEKYPRRRSLPPTEPRP